MSDTQRTPSTRSRTGAFGGGALIGALGGLIGLGGAEFRLPLLIAGFKFPPLEAIILNKAMSLIVVSAAIIFRTRSIPLAQVADHLDAIVNLLAGSLMGAWFGASWGTRLHSRTLYRLIAVLLVAIALVLLWGHGGLQTRPAAFTGVALWIAGAAAGFAIGIVSALLGVAGGELLIPTLVLLFGIDIRIAGSLSLAVSLPTMLVGFARYSRDRGFQVLSAHRAFVIVMAAGSIVGAFMGAALLGYVTPSALYPILAVILLISSIKVWRHD